MIPVNKIVGSLALPPGVFISITTIIAFVLGIFHARLRRRMVLFLFLIPAILLLLLSLEPVADALLLPLEDRYPPIQVDGNLRPLDILGDTPVTHIVVLGGGINPASPEAEGRGTLTPDSLKRTVYALGLHRRFGLPLVLTGGRGYGRHDAEPEAVVAARTLENLDVKTDMLIIEDRSTDTWENARNVAAMIGTSTVLLVTSAYHMPRGMRVFEQFDLRCVPAPTDYKVMRSGYTFLSYLPTISSLRNSYIALHEYLGLIYYALR